jgi:3',5'-cyclic-AMP phosphodiesterase
VRSIVNQSAKNPVRILQVTDPHLFADRSASLRGTVTHDTLVAVLDHIVAEDWQADIVAMTGDLIQDDSREAYQRFCELFAPLGLPVYCVPGNHDIRDYMRAALTAAPFHYCASYQQYNWLVVGIDSCKADSAGGQVAAAEMERLQKLIRNTQAEHVLVCLHHPPLPVGSAWLDGVGLEDGARFLATLAATGKVRGCLFGHVHQAFDEQFEGLRVIGTPSTCRQFKPGSDEFALDEEPPAYRRVELHANGRIKSELIWLPAAE